MEKYRLTLLLAQCMKKAKTQNYMQDNCDDVRTPQTPGDKGKLGVHPCALLRMVYGGCLP